jgi:hypothetical protein
VSPETQYRSGDDLVVEFLDYRYSFSRTDFTQRVVAAAIRLELVEQRDLSPAEASDLADLAAEGSVERPRSALGRYLRARQGALEQLNAEPLVYWLRKLVFRGAWLDHRVKAGLLDVSFDEETGTFGYRMPTDQAPLLELASVPSWSRLRFNEEERR